MMDARECSNPDGAPPPYDQETMPPSDHEAGGETRPAPQQENGNHESTAPRPTNGQPEIQDAAAATFPPPTSTDGSGQASQDWDFLQALSIFDRAQSSPQNNTYDWNSIRDIVFRLHGRMTVAELEAKRAWQEQREALSTRSDLNERLGRAHSWMAEFYHRALTAENHVTSLQQSEQQRSVHMGGKYINRFFPGSHDDVLTSRLDGAQRWRARITSSG
jgi:hypothetical protein